MTLAELKERGIEIKDELSFHPFDSGIKKNIPTPSDVKIKDLLIEFTKRVGVSKDLIGNKLLFVVNGAAISKINENKTVEQFFTMLTSYLSTQIKITVIDASNLIGA